MDAGKIYLYAVKREDGTVEVFDQDGRSLAGLRGVMISVSVDDVNRLTLDVNEMPGGKPCTGRVASNPTIPQPRNVGGK